MSELRIRQFGPIKELNIELKQFNLIIGEQATGKSTVCKVVYLFREIKNLLVDYLYEIILSGGNLTQLRRKMEARIGVLFEELFGDSRMLSSEMDLEYIYKADVSARVYAVQVSGGKIEIAVSFSQNLNNSLHILEKDAIGYHNALKNQDEIAGFVIKERARLHAVMEKQVDVVLGDDMHTCYIPAGRGLLTLMADQRTRFNYDKIDLVNRRFLQFVEEIQPKFTEGVPLDSKSSVNDAGLINMAEKLKECLQGDYIYRDKQEYLLVNDGQQNKMISFQFASSGQQEILWLLNQLYILALRGEKTFVIIEEPEAHVYPTLQREILEYIVYYMNWTGSTVLITTHSPYMLTAANVLYYGGRKIEDNETLKENVEDILGKYVYILPHRMQGYKLKKDTGTTEAIPLEDAESGELRTELIDEVSNRINRCYTELFYLEENVDGEYNED